MAQKLYVGGLPYQTTEEEIQELFSSAGQVVKVSLIIDRETGRSKGFAFVEMSTDEEAEKAIKEYNNYQLEGRTLIVNPAKPMEERKPFTGGQQRGGGSSFNRNRY